MKPLAINKKISYEYEILKIYNAGIELKGFEVKTISRRGVSLRGVYAIIREGEVWLINLDIPPYQPNNMPKEYDPKRNRKVLLKKSEIKELIGKTREKGLTLVPIKMYNKKSRIKLEIGLARSKKEFDKREAIKKRDVDKDMKREIKIGI